MPVEARPGGPAAALAAAALHAALLLVPWPEPARLSEPSVRVFLALWIGWSALEAAFARTGREPHVGHLDRTLAALTGSALLAMAWQGVRLPPLWRAGGAWSWVAASALVAGVAVRVAAVRALGDRFVTAARADPAVPLATRGVYRLVRHPSEAGLLAAALAGALLLRSGLALALWGFALLPLSLARVRREERLLRATYGEAHAQYRRATGLLLPRPAAPRR